jgi:vacuolar protein sorting-associated protein 54
VLRSEFDKYLSELGPEWQRWEQERKLGRTGRLDLGENGVGETSEGSVGGTDEGDSRRRVVEDVLPPLEGVPQIFFDPSFALSNPRTFDLVTERIRSDSRPNQFAPLNGSGPSTLADLATDEILQEKLSNYTAVIESHLVREIGLRSSSFFSALSNLQSLHEQGENCLSKITDLQSALSTDEMGIGGAAKRGLHILRTQARRRGLEKIEEGVRSVEEVWNGVEGVKELVEHGEWLGALEVSEQVEALYYGQDTAEDVPVSSTSTGPTFDLVVVDDSSPLPPPTSSRPPKKTRLNLTKVKTLNSVPQRLATFRATVAKSLEGELIGVLEHEMEVGVQEYMRSAATGSWKGKRRAETPVSPSGRTRSPAISFVDEGGDAGEDLARERAKERVRPVVRGLVRAEGMEGAVAAWREAMLKDVRLMVREVSTTASEGE